MLNREAKQLNFYSTLYHRIPEKHTAAVTKNRHLSCKPFIPYQEYKKTVNALIDVARMVGIPI